MKMKKFVFMCTSGVRVLQSLYSTRIAVSGYAANKTDRVTSKLIKLIERKKKMNS